MNPSPPLVPEPNSNLIVNYLPTTLTEEEFRALFTPYGTIHSCKLVKDRATGGSAGYGFIHYATSDNALRALSALNGHVMGSKRLKVSIARPNDQDDQNTNIYISSMPLHWTEADLSNLCAPFGTVIDAKVLTDLATKLSRGVGFVRMESRAVCEKIIQTISGNTPPGATNKLILKFAETAKESKHRKLLSAIPGGAEALQQLAAYNASRNANPTTSMQLHQASIDSLRLAAELAGANGTAPGFGYRHPQLMLQQPQAAAGFAPNYTNLLALQQQQQQQQQQHQHLHMQQPQQQHLSQPGLHLQSLPASPYPHPSLGSLSSPPPYSFGTVPGAITGAPGQYPQHVGLPLQNSVSLAGSMLSPGSTPSAGSPAGQVTASSPNGDYANGTPSGPDSGDANNLTSPKPAFAGVCLFVYHLVPDCTETMLIQLFSTCGKVMNAKVMRNFASGLSKGFGFVNMATQEQAELAIRTLNGYQLGNKTLKVDFKR